MFSSFLSQFQFIYFFIFICFVFPFYQKIVMKGYTKSGLPIFSIPSTPAHQSNTSTLQDSKSTSNLSQSSPENRKFRQTTFVPHAAKTSNRQFLRYTVKLNKSQKEALSSQIQESQDIRRDRKFTIQEQKKKPLEMQQPPTAVIIKTNSDNKQVQKKNTNPQGKQQQGFKQFPIPKFLYKKTMAADGTQQNYNKTERVITHHQAIGCLNSPKKTFTPKLNKNEDSYGANKIIASYSSSNLTKCNDSLHCITQPLTSRGYSIETFQKGPAINQFKKIRFLGEGKFGQVFLVFHIKTHSIYAMKQIKKQVIIKNNMENQLLMEIKMQFYLNHPNILKLYGIFKDEENIYLILQYMEEGTLYSLLRRKKTLKQFDASQKLRDVLDGLNYLHNKNIAHRDLKPENIVISNSVCKICDLGWAAVCDDRRKTLCGTIDYASPQILQGKQYGIAIDLWCLGVLCYQLIIGKCPFYHISRKQTMKKIINADLSDINLPQNLASQARDFICRLLIKNPEERMSTEVALLHPLITKYYDQDLEEIQNSQKKKN